MKNPPIHVSHVLNRLNDGGFQAYLVGGCVRDYLLGQPPKDYDIATDARPEQVVALFGHTVPTGIKYGTVTVLVDHVPVEVTTYRRDGRYSDGRRPDSVEFGESIEEDLARRDFTINAIAWSPKTGFKDPYQGQKDLLAKLVDVVGSTDRLREDALRMMRAVRFAATKGFSLAYRTQNGLLDFSHLLHNVAPERIREELNQILVSNGAEWALRYMAEVGLLQEFLPELMWCRDFDQHNPHHRKNVFDHILSVVSLLPAQLHLRLAGLLHDIAKPRTFVVDESGIGHFYGHEDAGAEMAEIILRRLAYDRKSIDTIVFLVQEHMFPGDMGCKGMRRFVVRAGERLGDLLELRRADAAAGKTPANVAYLETIQRVRDEMEREGIANPIISLAVNGFDVMQALDLRPGPQVGAVLKALAERILDEPHLNDRNTLLELLPKVAQ